MKKSRFTAASRFVISLSQGGKKNSLVADAPKEKESRLFIANDKPGLVQRAMIIRSNWRLM